MSVVSSLTFIGVPHEESGIARHERARSRVGSVDAEMRARIARRASVASYVPSSCQNTISVAAFVSAASSTGTADPITM